MGIKLIGIAGKARSGKDTFARALVDEHGFVRMAFADPLKIATAVTFGWPIERVLHDDAFKTYKCPLWGITVREALQRMGTEAVRGTFGDFFWIMRWAVDYVKVKNKFSVVVTDVRTDAEAKALRGEGGLIVHISRKGFGLDGALGEHSSEAGVTYDKQRDVSIENDGNVEELIDKAHRLVAFIEENSATFKLKNEGATNG